MADMTSPSAPEGGYGWIIVVVTFFSKTMMVPLMSSFPVLYKEYVDAFDSSGVVVATVLSYHLIFTDIGGFVFSGFLRYLDLRVVAMSGALVSALSCFLASFTHTISLLAVCYALSGVGCGVCYISTSPVIHQYFHKKRTLATGITTAGVSLGAFVFPPLTRFSIDFLGWRGTIRIFAALLMQNVWLYALERPLFPVATAPPKVDTVVSTKWYRMFWKYVKSLVDLKIFKHPGYWLYGLGVFCISLSFTGHMIHITNKCLREGIDPYRASLAPSISGIVNLIWRPAFGIIATRPPLRSNTRMLYGVAGVLIGLSVASVSAAHTFVHIVMAAIPAAIGLATLAIMFQPILVELVGLENMAHALSFLMIAMGTGQFIASPLAAWLFDISGSYTLPYLVLGGIGVVGGLVVLSIGPVTRKYRFSYHNPPQRHTNGCKLEQEFTEKTANQDSLSHT